MAVGHRLAVFHAACSCEEGGNMLPLVQYRFAFSPLFVSAAATVATIPSAPSALLQLDERPRHSGPTTAFPLRGRVRRWPCHLAHMELAAMSRPQGQQSPVRPAGWPAGRSQPPILDSSRPDAPLLLANLLSPFVTPKKHSRMYVIASKGAVPPAPRRASAK